MAKLESFSTKSDSYESAAKKLSVLGCATPLASRRNVEAEFGRLYQKLVREGKARQIKKKYRPF